MTNSTIAIKNGDQDTHGSASIARAIILGLRDLIVSAVFVYGYVYTSYKMSNPNFGGADFFHYKDMIGRPFDFSATQAPFVLRQTSALIATIFYRLGLHYDTATAIGLIGLDADTRMRFLALVLSNGVAVCLTLVLLAGYLRVRHSDLGLSGLFLLFGILSAWFWFPTIALAPETVAWGWLVSALFAIAFLERSLWLIVATAALAIITRETTIVFALGLFACAALFDRRKEQIGPVLVLAAASLVYLLLRVTMTHGYEHQISPASVLSGLMRLHTLPGFLKQSVISQGIFVVLLIAIAIENGRLACCLLAGVAAVTLVGFGAQISEFSAVTGETLPIFATFFIVSRRSSVRL